ncbi:MAG TPA: aldo/keto reductase [Gaiellales bacterium]|nr:aldo/keto reductase [Gaiellales bacterium]
MSSLGHIAVGSWSGGEHMRFGVPVGAERLAALLRPGDGITTVLTADVYGTGAADRDVGAALDGIERSSYRLVGMVGHDFTSGERAGAKGYPRFTDAALRGPEDYAGYLRRATEASLERCGVDHFDVLLLHNPDHTGYSSADVWDGMAALRDAGLAGAIGVAPGPANGFTLDVIACLERFGDRMDWAMLILNPFEPWPGRLALPACERAGVRVIARVVDYGGIFWDDVTDEEQFPEHDHRRFRPAGWVTEARAKLDRIRPIGERHGLTPLQLAAAWTLAQPAVACVAPTLIQEAGADARPVEDKRTELAEVPARSPLSSEELAAIDAVGDNTGCMALKGGSSAHEGDPRADAWPLDDELRATAERWGIAPERDLLPQPIRL